MIITLQSTGTNIKYVMCLSEIDLAIIALSFLDPFTNI
jgi:hypothetical protein